MIYYGNTFLHVVFGNVFRSSAGVRGYGLYGSKAVFTHWQLAVGYLLDELKNDITH